MGRIDAFFCSIPGPLRELSHLARQKGNGGSLEFLAKPGDQRLETVFILGCQLGLAVRLPLVPENSFQGSGR